MNYYSFVFFLLITLSTSCYNGNMKSLAEYVDPFIGTVESGACMPGPCLPFSSVYPSPNTLNGDNGGYAIDEKITGFAQLHAQGTGGLKPYGNFLLSPQIGLQIDEKDHQSSKVEELATAYYYKVRLEKYETLCELAPSSNSTIYRFTYPKSDSAIVLLDIARKNGGDLGLEEGMIEVSPDGQAAWGGGLYGNNWPDARHKWNMYFYAEFSEQAFESGVFEGEQIYEGKKTGFAKKTGLGAYMNFKTKPNQQILVKIAVSFISSEHAKQLLHKEIPAWDFEEVKNNAKAVWNNYLSRIQIEGSEEDKIIFYTHLFHAFVQPRNRTGNNSWQTNEEFWDDHYTLWDSWKTLFPLMCLIDQDMVASNIRSFINRHKHNGYVATAFINGKESPVGQGGNTVDNVIGDAFVKNISGVNWEQAYKVVKFNADSMRTPNYIKNGFVYDKEPNVYSGRFKAGSGTIAFSLNDYCVANIAKGLGKDDDFRFFDKRALNWRNTWNDSATSDGYSGFIMARNQDGSFNEIDPKKGYNKHFYEGSCWEYSYELPHSVSEMVQVMGGKETFVERLNHSLTNNLIDFGNEPSFMTPWLFANENVGRPDLTSYYVRTQLLPLYTRYNLPGDDDQGAMASLFIFAKLGLFPFAGTDMYYLHGGSYPKATLQLPENKKLEIISTNASPENIYIKSVKLNGSLLNKSWVKHEEIINGGILEFEMTNKPINFLVAREQIR